MAISPRAYAESTSVIAVSPKFYIAVPTVEIISPKEGETLRPGETYQWEIELMHLH